MLGSDLARIPPEESVPVEDEPLFHSALQAIRFAVTREGRAPRPATSRMLDPMGSGRDFSALDAAAQAGMIMNVLRQLGRLQMAVLIANAAPRTNPCPCRRPCCSGKRANHHWAESVDIIAQDSRKALPPGSKLSYPLRASIVVKIYGAGRISFQEIGEQLMVDWETVQRQHRAIYRWLMGEKASRNAQAVEGIDPFAWSEAETRLRSAGIVR